MAFGRDGEGGLSEEDRTLIEAAGNFFDTKFIPAFAINSAIDRNELLHLYQVAGEKFDMGHLRRAMIRRTDAIYNGANYKYKNRRIPTDEEALIIDAKKRIAEIVSSALVSESGSRAIEEV